ncbi:hypothetical protein RCMENCHIE_68 [Rhodobacter phage RcMenchie]|nr:hypothetical protein RCMENCHIE_68 [Rhodobacter phage RcMenchie]
MTNINATIRLTQEVTRNSHCFTVSVDFAIIDHRGADPFDAHVADSCAFSVTFELSRRAQLPCRMTPTLTHNDEEQAGSKALLVEYAYALAAAIRADRRTVTGFADDAVLPVFYFHMETDPVPFARYVDVSVTCFARPPMTDTGTARRLNIDDVSFDTVEREFRDARRGNPRIRDTVAGPKQIERFRIRVTTASGGDDTPNASDVAIHFDKTRDEPLGSADFHPDMEIYDDDSSYVGVDFAGEYAEDYYVLRNKVVGSHRERAASIFSTRTQTFLTINKHEVHDGVTMSTLAAFMAAIESYNRFEPHHLIFNEVLISVAANTSGDIEEVAEYPYKLHMWFVKPHHDHRTSELFRVVEYPEAIKRMVTEFRANQIIGGESIATTIAGTIDSMSAFSNTLQSIAQQGVEMKEAFEALSRLLDIQISVKFNPPIEELPPDIAKALSDDALRVTNEARYDRTPQRQSVKIDGYDQPLTYTTQLDFRQFRDASKNGKKVSVLEYVVEVDAACVSMKPTKIRVGKRVINLSTRRKK